MEGRRREKENGSILLAKLAQHPFRRRPTLRRSMLFRSRPHNVHGGEEGREEERKREEGTPYNAMSCLSASLSFILSAGLCARCTRRAAERRGGGEERGGKRGRSLTTSNCNRLLCDPRAVARPNTRRDRGRNAEVLVVRKKKEGGREGRGKKKKKRRGEGKRSIYHRSGFHFDPTSSSHVSGSRNNLRIRPVTACWEGEKKRGEEEGGGAVSSWSRHHSLSLVPSALNRRGRLSTSERRGRRGGGKKEKRKKKGLSYPSRLALISNASPPVNVVEEEGGGREKRRLRSGLAWLARSSVAR